VSPERAGGIRELLLDVHEHRTWDVSFEVRPPPEIGIVERPASIDEAIAHV